MPQGFDISTVVLLVLAGFVVWRLRSVLGQRTGAERPPTEPQRTSRDAASAEPRSNDNVIPLPGMPKAEPEPVDPALRWKGITDPNGAAVSGMERIMGVDRAFEPRMFVGGAKSAYEMIVLGFAKGDKAGLKDLLSADVFDSFASVIDQRVQRSEKAEATFVSIDQPEVLQAELNGSTAELTVRFVSKIISAVRNAAGAVVDGSAEKLVDVTDIWTFARDTKSRDPNWRVVSTEADG